MSTTSTPTHLHLPINSILTFSFHVIYPHHHFSRKSSTSLIAGHGLRAPRRPGSGQIQITKVGTYLHISLLYYPQAAPAAIGVSFQPNGMQIKTILHESFTLLIRRNTYTIH